MLCRRPERWHVLQAEAVPRRTLGGWLVVFKVERWGPSSPCRRRSRSSTRNRISSAFILGWGGSWGGSWRGWSQSNRLQVCAVPRSSARPAAAARGYVLKRWARGRKKDQCKGEERERNEWVGSLSTKIQVILKGSSTGRAVQQTTYTPC